MIDIHKFMGGSLLLWAWLGDEGNKNIEAAVEQKCPKTELVQISISRPKRCVGLRKPGRRDHPEPVFQNAVFSSYSWNEGRIAQSIKPDIRPAMAPSRLLSSSTGRLRPRVPTD